MKCLESLFFVLIFCIQLSWSQWTNVPIIHGSSTYDAYVGGWGNQIVVGCYDKPYMIYNTLTNTWRNTNRKPIAYWRSVSAASANGFTYFFGGQIFVAGGWEPSGQVEIYKHSTNSWSQRGTYHSHGYSTGTKGIAFPLQGIGIGKYVMFAGGRNSIQTTINHASYFNTETGINHFFTLSSRRTGIIATTLGTKAFFMGGSQDDRSGTYPYPLLPVDSFEIFESSNGTWRTSTLPFPWHKGSAAGAGDLIFLAGGYTLDSDDQEVPLPCVQRQGRQMVQSRRVCPPQWNQVCFIESMTIKNFPGLHFFWSKVFIAGGQGESETFSDVYIFDTETGITNHTNLPAARKDMVVLHWETNLFLLLAVRLRWIFMTIPLYQQLEQQEPLERPSQQERQK